MAADFIKQKKSQRNLIIVFVLIIIIAIIVFWQGFFKKEIPFSPEEVFLPPTEKIEINFEIFKKPDLKELQPFAEIEPFKEIPSTEDAPGEKIGRENPFLPY